MRSDERDQARQRLDRVTSGAGRAEVGDLPPRALPGVDPAEAVSAVTEPFVVPAPRGREDERWAEDHDRAGSRAPADEPDTPDPGGPPQLGTRWLGGSRAALAGVVVMLAVLCGGAARFVFDEATPPHVEVPRSDAANSVASRATGGSAAWPVELAGTPSPSPISGSDATSPSGPPSSAGTPSVLLVVHVVGQVRRVGVVRLTAGARVEDAVRAAGGATASADLARVNLARPVVDGEQIMVPRPGEPLSGGVVAGTPGAAPSGGAAGAVPTGVIDLNAATAQQLDALPGIGPVLAGRIVDWRTTNGRFTSVEELGEIEGIGDAVLGRLRPLVRV